jgi:formate dehydrogenase subunit beta
MRFPQYRYPHYGKQNKREQLVIIGVPCLGMIDKRKVALETDGEILSVAEAGDRITVTTAAGETTYAKADMLQSNCSVCQHRNPVIHDEMVADPVEEQTDVDRYADVKAIEAMDSEEKWQLFEDLLSPCIRCYACRNACPLCYCPTCFVDESKPQWVGKSQDRVGRAHLSTFCGPTTVPAAAPIAVPANGPARWASTCGP